VVLCPAWAELQLIDFPSPSLRQNEHNHFKPQEHWQNAREQLKGQAGGGFVEDADDVSDFFVVGVCGTLAPTLLAQNLSQWNTPAVIIGDRLRELREEKKLSQGDVEKRTGLLRPYISRVENGHTVPAIETLEKMARALEVPLYQLFYEGEEPPPLPNLLKRKSSDDIVWGSSGKEARYLNKLRRLLGKTDEQHRKIILLLAQKMALR
jgi:transcriptional regulator with XRE-family HTH domain